VLKSLHRDLWPIRPYNIYYIINAHSSHNIYKIERKNTRVCLYIIVGTFSGNENENGVSKTAASSTRSISNDIAARAINLLLSRPAELKRHDLERQRVICYIQLDILFCSYNAPPYPPRTSLRIYDASAEELFRYTSHGGAETYIIYFSGPLGARSRRFRNKSVL